MKLELARDKKSKRLILSKEAITVIAARIRRDVGHYCHMDIPDTVPDECLVSLTTNTDIDRFMAIDREKRGAVAQWARERGITHSSYRGHMLFLGHKIKKFLWRFEFPKPVQPIGDHEYLESKGQSRIEIH